MSEPETSPAPPAEVTAENVERVLAAYGHHGKDFGIISKAGEFVEDLHSDKTFPGFKGAVGFPMDEVCRRLDGEPVHDRQSDRTAPDTAAALAVLFDWLALSEKADTGEIKIRDDERVISFIGKRALAAMWVTKPALFGGLPARTVAERFGISTFNFSRITSAFSRQFGIRNVFQAHDAKNKPLRRTKERKSNGRT